MLILSKVLVANTVIYCFSVLHSSKAERAQYIPKGGIPQFVPRSDTADVSTMLNILRLGHY